MKKKCPVCLCLVESSAATCNFCKTPLKISNSIQKTEINKPTFTPPVVVLDKKITNTSTKMTPDMINMINTQYKNITGENERALEIKNSTKPLVEENTNNHSFLEIETDKNDNHSSNSFVEEKKVENNSGFLRFEDIPIIKEKNFNTNDIRKKITENIEKKF